MRAFRHRRSAELRRIDTGEFARRLNSATKGDEKKRFAFFLGAGCSISSGIPGAGDLVKERWLPRLFELVSPEEPDINKWAQSELTRWNPDNPASSYGEVIQKLFLTPGDRQLEIEAICDGKSPGFGYAVLSGLMVQDHGHFNVVLTTNFDDMVEDALMIYQLKRPLVIHHDSLAPFIRPTRMKPMVVKLHGDHQLAPRNTTVETEELAEIVVQRVATVLHDRGLIVMGYGGNDESIFRLFSELPDEALQLGIYWVSGTEPRGVVRALLEDRGAVWVKNNDFDQLMLILQQTFHVPHPTTDKHASIVANCIDAFKKLETSIDTSVDSDEKKVLTKALQKSRRTLPPWYADYMNAIFLRNSNPNQADHYFEKAITASSGNPGVFGDYANFLTDVRQDHDRAEEFYKLAIEANPNHVNNLGNYAKFLTKVRQDHDRAEEFYKRAIEADPKQAISLSNYATFLTKARQKHDHAEEFYKRAIEADPKQAISLGNYANFLTKIRQDHDRAEEFYKRAIEADPKQAANLGNYANFLTDVRQDHDHAEEFYKRAIEADQKQATNLGNYASFLTRIRQDHDRAEEFYKRAIEADPKQVSYLGNYAVLLTDIRQDHDRAEEFYKRAIEAEPKNANIVGNYANFLTDVRQRHDQAEEFYRRAIEVDPKHVSSLGNYAVFLMNIRQDYEHAEEFYKRAVEADSKHANHLGNYAQFLLARGRNDEGLVRLAQAIQYASSEQLDLLAELRFYQYAHAPETERSQALKELKKLLLNGGRSKGWNLQPNIDRAKQNGHPAGEWLDKLAAVITKGADISTLTGWPEWDVA